ncbi:UDP-N-acetylglucosamine 2-epimerase [Tannerella forsythia]|uniref:UDP-N-acetylglucosamine 2-epimerase n=1 Tax=Tannerella forsythia TaxID=28112 RepID=UPI0028E82810|nr:UDP-N-acetylglucosamine 2-epimerase [Tannerella forsythia]
MRKVCVVTGTRAEYGLLSRLMWLIRADHDLTLQIIATNMHLSPEFGLTYKEIEADGFTIDKKVEMLLSSDTSNAITKSIGLATIGFADAYEDLQPDILLILGDRFEILAAATAALIYKIPVAHLHGGEITEGAYDDAIRHAITKMSHLHFVSTEIYRQRVIQMGEHPSTVFNVGALGCENIKSLKLMRKDELEKSLGFKLDRNTILITYHPVTMECNTSEQQFRELLSAIDLFPELKVIFTMPNSDTDGRIIMKMIKEYVAKNPERTVWFDSLGCYRYLSVLQYIGGVIGNSSSGIIEVPSFHIPTINIGDRQKGRVAAASVLNSKPTQQDIQQRLAAILAPGYLNSLVSVTNPYDMPDTAKNILDTLKHQPIVSIKSFYNLSIDE